MDLFICNTQLFYSTDDKFLNILAQKHNSSSWVYIATFTFFLDKDKKHNYPKRVHNVVCKNSTTNRIQNWVVINVSMCRKHKEKNWPYSSSSAWILTV